MLNLIICGAPGSGKGTQSDLIVEKYNLKHLSTGDLLRAEVASGSELGNVINGYISKGELLPDALMIELLVKQIDILANHGNGFILDGFPRTVAQAEALEDILNKRNLGISTLIDLNVADEELISRLLKRGETSGRADDNLETITQRLQVYNEKTKPVSAFYQSINKYSDIDGMGTVEEIFGRICTAIEAVK